MSLLKKLLVLKNELGFVLTGLVFAVIGGLVLVKSKDGELAVPLAFMGIGIAVFAVGLLKVLKELKTPADEHRQYDRIDAKAEPPADFVQAYDPEETEDFVFHYTGKGNQSYVMEDRNGAAVYEAITDKLLAVKARPFVFRNCMDGTENTRMIGAAVTTSVGGSERFGGMNISSGFKIDGSDIWEEIAAQGYGFTFSMHGIAAHYEVRRWNKPVGFAEMCGTGLFDPRYRNNPLGKVPSNGIFRVCCRRCDVPGLFLICFAISHTELTLE